MRDNHRGPGWIAKQSGYSREWISSVVHGRKPLSDDLAKILTEKLGIPLEPQEYPVPMNPGPTRFYAPTEATGEIVINPEPRCPCVLVLDPAFVRDPVLNGAVVAGFRAIESEFRRDRLTARRVEIAVVIAGEPAELRSPFRPGYDIEGSTALVVDPNAAPKVAQRGRTKHAAGIRVALNLLDERRAEYQRDAIDGYRPWVVLLAVHPTEESEAERRPVIVEIARRERAGFASFFAFAIGRRGSSWLEGSGLRPPLGIERDRLPACFSWIAASLQRVTSSIPGERVTLPDSSAFALSPN
jgi:uncharacterized protein YegL